MWQEYRRDVSGTVLLWHQGLKHGNVARKQLEISGGALIPAFNISNVLPPFLGANPTTPSVSPYDTTMVELVAKYATSPACRHKFICLTNGAL